MEKRFDEKYIKFHSDNPGCVLLTLKNDGSLIDDDEIRFSLKRFISQEIQLAVEGERQKTKTARLLIENCLNYCKEANGRPDCKNCGLDSEVLTQLN